jgi:hypothetical protein
MCDGALVRITSSGVWFGALELPRPSSPHSNSRRGSCRYISLSEASDYFVAHVAQISRGNEQVNAVNSTDLVWHNLVRDQEVGGSNPLAPTNYFTINNLQTRK